MPGPSPRRAVLVGQPPVSLGTHARTRSSTSASSSGRTPYGTEEEKAAAETGCRFNLAFYGSTPAYKVTLDAHGWGALQPELNRLTKEGRWAEMGAVIDDEVLQTICVCGTPAEVAATLRRRYDGIADRIAFSVPYGVRRELLAEVLDRVRTG